MKKTLFTLTAVLLAVAAQAQIKVHSDGQVSIGSLSTTYGVQVHPSTFTTFQSQSTSDWSWVEMSRSKGKK